MTHLDTNKIRLIKDRIRMLQNRSGKQISHLRKDRNMGLQELAKATDMTPAYWSIIENGKQSISIGSLLKLAEIYDVSLDYLAGLSNITDKYEPASEHKEHFLNLRLDNNMTQFDMATLLDYHSCTPIHRQEKNGVAMKLSRLIMLSEYFDVPVDYILGLTDDKVRHTKSQNQVIHNGR